MASMILIAPVAMATTQLARVVRYQEASDWVSPRVERTPLRMSWVVATEGDGKRKLQIEWFSSV
jgi:hypothetical protein